MRHKAVTLLVVTFFSLTALNLSSEDQLPSNTKVDKLVIYKSQRKLMAYSKGRLIKIYSIALGGSPIGHKKYEGDMKTPEGSYSINDKNPNSAYHKNLGISYPNADDIAYAKKLGKSPGGAIKIHGLRNGTGLIGKLHRWVDWTQGCIAVTNGEIDELYRAVAVGTPIMIHP
ncbi:murein L,D-transpeptidase family protein [Pontibacter sp. BAB1700]|uniref:L,D-transpeptidase family protein n=1 Tax=Pontibacter sp. BAB1700 TaxID=1144253 RepID=UPI00058E936F|nr:L,D-transpeptidase family protein [Pontibacter sp. BAB1700]